MQKSSKTKATSSAKLGDYYRLTKPGIIRGNLLTGIAGFMLAAQGDVDWLALVGFSLGLALIIAAACVMNNLMDKDLDRNMKRTKQRALVTGLISDRSAQHFAAGLGLLGSLSLAILTNALTLAIGLFGMFAYVVIYGWAKRRTIHSTLIGSISGAVPPAAGYTAVTGELGQAPLLLFLILVTWQMPHFYAIAIYRKREYAAAGIHLLPHEKGNASTRRYIRVWIMAFILAISSLWYYGYTSNIYLGVMYILSFYWLGTAFSNNGDGNDDAWAKRIFRFSLIVLLGWCLTVVIDSFV